MRINHTDPWLRHDPFRTSRTVGFQTTRSSGNAIHGRAADDLANREGGLSHWWFHASTSRPESLCLHIGLTGLARRLGGPGLKDLYAVVDLGVHLGLDAETSLCQSRTPRRAMSRCCTFAFAQGLKRSCDDCSTMAWSATGLCCPYSCSWPQLRAEDAVRSLLRLDQRI